MVRGRLPARRHAVLVRLSDKERAGLDVLREKETLAAAQILRRLLIRELRQCASEPVAAK